ncbi:complement C1q domain-containing protein [Azospirillum argentinense]|uniref:C1q domain-containing protein n=1 Tax=Azospirillum argentinense TaxID=2970906 RepID=A0ABW8VE59_9PROT
MSVQTFYPSPVDQSATNWAVARRIVGPFAPRELTIPSMSLGLDAGWLLKESNLLEVPDQTVGPFASTANERVDRVVIDRSTGEAEIILGVESSTVPPAIPAGKLPVAQVHLLNSTLAITNDIIVDERALHEAPPDRTIFRATASVPQPSAPSSTWVAVKLASPNPDVGSGYDATEQCFKAPYSGYYLISGQVGMAMKLGSFLKVGLWKEQAIIAEGIVAPVAAGQDMTASATTIVHLDAGEKVRLYLYHYNGTTTAVSSMEIRTFLCVTRLA